MSAFSIPESDIETIQYLQAIISWEPPYLSMQK